LPPTPCPDDEAVAPPAPELEAWVVVEPPAPELAELEKMRCSLVAEHAPANAIERASAESAHTVPDLFDMVLTSASAG
jgi:hypothetical protein